MKPLMVILATLTLQAQEPAGPWSAFGKDSWVIVRCQESGGGETVTYRRKYLLSDVTAGGEAVLKTWIDLKGKFEEEDSQVVHLTPSKLGERMKLVKERAAQLAIGPKKVACTVEEYAADSPQSERTLLVWTSKDVRVPKRGTFGTGRDVIPSNVLRTERTVKTLSGLETEVVTIASLDEKLKIKDREVSCIVETLTGERTGGGTPRKVEGKRWFSDAVPGRLVKSEVTRTGGKADKILEEVVDFEAKKP